MDRIEVNPASCTRQSFKPRHAHHGAEHLGHRCGGYSIDRILASYPELGLEDVVAAIEYAAKMMDEDQGIAH